MSKDIKVNQVVLVRPAFAPHGVGDDNSGMGRVIEIGKDALHGMYATIQLLESGLVVERYFFEITILT